ILSLAPSLSPSLFFSFSPSLSLSFSFPLSFSLSLSLSLQVHVPNSCEFGSRGDVVEEAEFDDLVFVRDPEELRKDPLTCFFEGEHHTHGSHCLPPMGFSPSLASLPMLLEGDQCKTALLTTQVMQTHMSAQPTSLSHTHTHRAAHSTTFSITHTRTHTHNHICLHILQQSQRHT